MSDQKVLPICHPSYKYFPSNNIYFNKLLETKNIPVLVGNDAEMHRGNWMGIFKKISKTPKINVEIGCNGGHVLLKWAESNPKDAYIGIDWKYKQIFRGCEKAHQGGLNNILFLRAHARRLNFMFAPSEIDHLYVFFPDPWPKKAQLKNRFLTTKSLVEFWELIKKGGSFEIRTDHKGYYDWIIEALNAGGFDLQTASLVEDVYADHPDPEALEIPEVTLFEKIFIKKRLPIYKIHLNKQ